VSEFLQTYDLILTTVGPVFIGDGGVILKKSYLLDPSSKKVSIVNEEKLFSLLVEKNLVDRYEQFMLYDKFPDLNSFLEACGFTSANPPEPEIVQYTIAAGDALDKDHSRKEIHTFIRNAKGEAYIPGSSLKGAIRTVLLQQMIRSEGKEHSALVGADQKNFGKIPEEEYLHTLQLTEKKQNAINSIMRGLQVSDSLPIPNEAFILATKHDVTVYGDINVVNCCRESIRPGTKIRFKLTLDQSILKGTITKEFILEAVENYADYYYDTYIMHFDEPEQEASVEYKNCIFLGGGAGFFSKSLVYPYLGEERARKVTAEMMTKFFSKHGHDRDNECHKISPHMLKYAKYRSELYPMGMCKVEIR